MSKTLVLNSQQIDQRINRIAWELYENNHEEKEIFLAGIAPNGFILAKRIGKILENISGIKTKTIEIKVNKNEPLKEQIDISLREDELKNKVIILVDDVLNSGKTLIYGAKEFLKAPVKKLSTVVLVDRNHTRYPVKADFVGISLSTTMQEHITVELDKKEKEAVYLA
jgi:pyrimidine operon attenuation protein / uracil phosphoribosyltransferase